MQNFAVKQRYGSFNAVAGDMKLVQIIQQSQKGTGGIIGKTRQSEYVTKRETVYHEILSLSNTFREITNTNFGSRETKIHHEFDKHFCSMFNSLVKTVAEFILNKENPYKMLVPNLYKSLQNPYKMLVPNLYNFVSGTAIPSTATNNTLNCYLQGKEQYEIFRTEHFIDQSKKL